MVYKPYSCQPKVGRSRPANDSHSAANGALGRSSVRAASIAPPRGWARPGVRACLIVDERRSPAAMRCWTAVRMRERPCHTLATARTVERPAKRRGDATGDGTETVASETLAVLQEPTETRQDPIEPSPHRNVRGSHTASSYPPSGAIVTDPTATTGCCRRSACCARRARPGDEPARVERTMAPVRDEPGPSTFARSLRLVPTTRRRAREAQPSNSAPS